MTPVICMNFRGSPTLIWRGNKYRKNGDPYAKKVRWRCTSHSKYNCKALVHTVEGTIVYYSDKHTTCLKSRDVNKNPQNLYL